MGIFRVVEDLPPQLDLASVRLFLLVRATQQRSEASYRVTKSWQLNLRGSFMIGTHWYDLCKEVLLEVYL